MSRSSPRRGFTIVELAVVLAIVALMAILAINALQGVIRRGTVGQAHHTIGQAFEQAKAMAYGHANDIVFVIVGNATPAAAALCGTNTFQPMLDARCVRYWLLEDVIAPNPGGSAKFDAAELALFDPLNPASRGDRVLGSGYLGRGVLIGTGKAGYLPPAPVAGSLFEGLTLVAADLPCSFCTTTTAPQRGFIRFGADGQVRMGNDTVAPKSLIGGFISFTGAEPGGSRIAVSNWVAISVPAGLVTERFSASEK